MSVEALRILYVNSFRGWGGGPTSTLELGTGLADRGHEVTVVCHPGSVLRKRLDGDPRVRLAPVAIRSDVNPIRVVQLARLLRRLEPDVALADRRKDVKLTVTARGLPGADPPIVHRHGAPSGLRDSFVYRAIWRRGVQALIVNSKTMREHLLAHTPWLEHVPIHVIHNGKDIRRYRPRPELRDGMRARLGIPADRFVAGYVGILQARKNVHLLIEAIGRLAHEAPVHALIVGGGPSGSELRDLTRRLGAPVTFTGLRADVPEVLSAADVAVHLSSAEGFSNSVVEAMACGLPVVASDATSHPEQVEHGVHGLLVTPGRPDAVADAIRSLAADAERRRAMARRARDRALSEFSRESMVERYETVLRETVDAFASGRDAGASRGTWLASGGS